MRLSLATLIARRAILRVFVVLCLAPCSLFGQMPKLTTFPSPPPANQPFDGELSILALPKAIGPTPPSPAFASDSYIRFWFNNCGSPCLSGEPEYQTFPLHFPALGAGTYRVDFDSIADVDPPLPPIAMFSLRIGADPSPIPALGIPASIVVVLSLIALTCRTLSKRGEAAL